MSSYLALLAAMAALVTASPIDISKRAAKPPSVTNYWDYFPSRTPSVTHYWTPPSGILTDLPIPSGVLSVATHVPRAEAHSIPLAHPIPSDDLPATAHGFAVPGYTATAHLGHGPVVAPSAYSAFTATAHMAHPPAVPTSAPKTVAALRKTTFTTVTVPSTRTLTTHQTTHSVIPSTSADSAAPILTIESTAHPIIPSASVKPAAPILTIQSTAHPIIPSASVAPAAPIVTIQPSPALILPPSRIGHYIPLWRPTCTRPPGEYEPPKGACFPGCDINADGVCNTQDEAESYPPIGK